MRLSITHRILSEIPIQLLLLCTLTLTLLNSNCAGSPASDDTDGDGLTNECEEQIFMTDPNNWDTDGDGIADGSEDHDGDGDSNILEQDEHYRVESGVCIEY